MNEINKQDNLKSNMNNKRVTMHKDGLFIDVYTKYDIRLLFSPFSMLLLGQFKLTLIYIIIFLFLCNFINAFLLIILLNFFSYKYISIYIYDQYLKKGFTIFNSN